MRQRLPVWWLVGLLGCAEHHGPPPVPSLPAVEDFGGPKLAHPQLVPIVYADDTAADALISYHQWLVSSRWLTAVGAEYGVGAGAVLGSVRDPANAPNQISDQQIVDSLYARIAAGTLPRPTGAGLGDALYVVMFPSHTVVSSPDGLSCRNFNGYHNSARRGGVELAYAVIAACPGNSLGVTDLELRELTISHEVIEAATDPIPQQYPGFQLRDPTTPWRAFGIEVADLCVRGDAGDVWREAGNVAQRSWSNAAAAVGEPCIPAPSAAPYFNVFPNVHSIPRVGLQHYTTIDLVGWSTGEVGTWSLAVSNIDAGTAKLRLGATELKPGATTTIDVGIPATASGGGVKFAIKSTLSADQYQLMPLVFEIGAPCSEFVGCEACSSEIGCGYCASSGRCEAEGASGSAQSSCPASEFATWPGSCPGYCASHATCADCTDQAGCGWCASATGPHCVEASHLQGVPAAGSCPAADWSFIPEYCPAP